MKISQSTVCNKREDQNTQIETKTAIDKMRYVEFSFHQHLAIEVLFPDARQ